MGLAQVASHLPSQASGGQKQRCAVARAVVNEPAIVFADEPTGALDSKASAKLLDLFGEINAEGQTILMVTHSIQAASHAGRVLFIKDGCVFHQIYRGERSKDAMYRMISDTLTVLQTENGTAYDMGTDESEISNTGVNGHAERSRHE